MISLQQACIDFYAMQVIDIEHNVEGVKYKRFVKFKSTFTKQLAQAMEDYLVLACAGEMRHGRHKCDMCYSSFPSGGSRSNVWGDIVRFEPKHIMNMAATLFQDYKWESGYGGKKWGQCAQAYVERHTKEHIMQKDTVFVDHCFDLQHNNGTVFNKGCDIFRDTGIGYLLDVKLDHVEGVFNSFAVSPIIVLHMVELGVEYSGTFIKSSHPMDEVINYKPIKWGNLKMDDTLVYGRGYSDDDEEEDDEDEEEESSETCPTYKKPSTGKSGTGDKYACHNYTYEPSGIRVSQNSVSVDTAPMAGKTNNNQGESGYNRDEYLASIAQRFIR